jgi:glutamate-5-semialdehyde dehydrogenase
MAARARGAYQTLAASEPALRQTALQAMASHIDASREAVLAANALDMAAATERGLPDAMCDRLLLNEARIAGMVQAIHQVASQPDPLGRVLDAWDNPQNGLSFEKVTIPIGVIGMIYESAPT